MSGRRFVFVLGSIGMLAAITWPGAIPKSSAAALTDKEQSAKETVDVNAEADKLLRAGKSDEARKILEPLLKDLKDGPARARALYLHGLAGFLLKDYEAAGRSLAALAPFEQPVFGPHARYLMARVHQQGDERAEAIAGFEDVLSEYEARKAKAVEALKQPDNFKDNPEEKTQLEAFVAAAPPDYVSRAGFYLGILTYEAGRFADARTRFADFAALKGNSPLRPDAQLFQGFSEVQLQQYADAIETLSPLTDNDSTRNVLAMWWLGKAQSNAADPDDEEATAAAVTKGLDTLRRAAEKARPVPDDGSPRARAAHTLRGEILLDVAETSVRAGQAKDAAAVFGEILESNLLPKREEEILQRWASALSLAGLFQESNAVCARFEKDYPRSTLLPEVLFRRAENAFLLALSNKKEAARLNEEAAKAYQKVADGFPEFPDAGLARYGVALVHYRRGEYENAQAQLEKISAQDFNGELLYVPLVLADCLIRITPTRADDALAAGRIEEQLGRAAALLNDFASAQADDPRVPDALLRLGLCRQRLATLIAKEDERKKMLESARSAYDKILTDYPLNDLRPQAALERARCIALLGDANESINRLRAFSLEPLVKQPVAPLAMLQWATLLRGQDNKAIEAAKIMTQCRKRHEKALRNDPARAGWVPLLLFHQAAALQESGQFGEARAAYEALIKEYPDRPEATEALLFLGQCLRDEGAQKTDQANQTLGMPDLKPAAAEAAKKSLEEGQKMSREAVQYFEKKAEELARKQPASEVRARLLYQAAWINRGLGDQEVEAARNKMREELQARLQQEAAKNTPEGQPVPMVQPPEVPLSKIELQPSEKKARALYQALLEAFPDLPLTNSVRLELAEMHATRGEHPAAVKLLKEALDREPPADMTEKVRMRLGVCLAAQGDAKAALAQFETVARNAESGFAAQAHYLAGDTLLNQGDLDTAVKHLILFRDQEKFQLMGGISDVALLRLGHAFAKGKKWDDCRKTLGLMLERFNESPWAAEARYAIGWAFQQEKKHDEALAAFSLVTTGPKSETVARTQLQMGICQLIRKQPGDALELFRALQSDNPDSSALALLEAAHCYTLLGQDPEAAKLLKQIVQDYAKTPWAEAAQKRLDGTEASPPHELPAAIRLMTPEVKDAWKLDPLGQMQGDNASQDDPTVEASHALTLSRPLPLRDKPAVWLRLALPEPFEFRLPIRAEDFPAEEMLPAMEEKQEPPKERS